MTQPLRGNPATNDRVEEDRLAIGGLRDATASLKRLPSVVAFGAKLGDSLMQLLEDNASWVSQTCSCIGSESAKPPPEAVVAVREIIAAACGSQINKPVFNSTCTTNIRASLLESWRKAAGDPDTEVYTWLTEGSPAGIRNSARPCGIFPVASCDVELDAESLTTAYDEF